MAGSNHYNTKGLYNSYDKNHKTRDTWDYYSTPTEEVENILNILQYDFNGDIILEPCAGEGHMAMGIQNYLSKNDQLGAHLVCTEFQDRKNKFPNSLIQLHFGKQYDFLSDNYEEALQDLIGIADVDWIIMNPPYATIEPFVIRALEIAKKGVIMLGRLQFLEGQGRYENIFASNPPTEIYTYVDRIQCYKGGNTEIKGSSVQAYSWFIFNKENKERNYSIHKWIRRTDKIDK